MLAKVAKDVFLRSSLKINHLKSLNHIPRTAYSSSSNSENPAAAEQNTGGESEFKETKEKLAKCELDLADFKDKYLRAMAETENTRVRMRKEIDNVKVFGIQSFCKDLLEVADVLNLAIVNTNPSKETDGSIEKLQSMHRGLVMTESCLLKIFEKHGLVRIMPSEGEKFDPNQHEAIFRVPDSDQQSGTIKIVSKIGYKLHERVVRAAQVGVVQ
jgi:molecular chaperone GrpE